jgi:hypothetical protein
MADASRAASTANAITTVLDTSSGTLVSCHTPAIESSASGCARGVFTKIMASENPRPQ